MGLVETTEANYPAGMVVHCKVQPYGVYIGKGSKWHNPYPIGKGMPRPAAVAAFEQWLMAPAQAGLYGQLPELAGHVLGCWCAPKQCHGGVLLKHLAMVCLPGAQGVHRQVTYLPYTQGYDAFGFGLANGANPYRHTGLDAEYMWTEGWLYAREQGVRYGR